MGIIKINGTSAPTGPLVFTALNKILPSRNPDLDHWWNLTGSHLATLFEAADYTLEKQYESLLFHYYWVVPYLGPRPQPGVAHKWRSILGIEGSPIEYSWKWNTKTSPPNVRITLEAIDQYSGTKVDPLNQHATSELLHRVAKAFPGVDTTWADHFFSTLYESDPAKYVPDAEKGAHFHTTAMSAIEFLPSGIGFKTYFIPRKAGQKDGPIPLAQWEDYIKPLHSGENKPLATVTDFLQNNPEGEHLHAIMVAVDDVNPDDSRLKLYFHTAHTSWESVKEIMTLGGTISASEESLHELKTFTYAIAGLPADFPEDQEAPLYSEYNPKSNQDSNDEPAVLMGGYQYYIDVAPSMDVPEVKFFTPSRRYGPNDLQMAQGITKWMDSVGRGQYCDRFLDSLQKLASHRPLDKGKGIQTFIACLIKPSGDLDITSYIGPEAWSPNRLADASA